MSSGKQKGSSSNQTALQNGPGAATTGGQGGTGSKPTEPTWVHEIFQGTLTNETRCLNCETVSSTHMENAAVPQKGADRFWLERFQN